MTQFFAIVFVGRSGSSYLEALLDSHPDAQCLAEILWQPPGEEKPLAELLDGRVHAVAHKKASGLKIGHLHFTRHPELISLMRAKDYRIIHILRQNRLDQYISMKLAQLNNSWRSDYGAYTTFRFRADADEVEAAILSFENEDAALERLVDGMPLLRMTYEELLAPRGYAPALEFLGLRPAALTSKYARQRPASQRAAIENYDEIATRFSGSGIGRYFVE